MANYFSIFLTVITVLTGILWAIDAWKFRPARKQKLQDEAQRLNTELSEDMRQQLAPQPVWAEYSQSIFPIIAAVLILRTFLYEPFQIPSGSMMPTLLRGDFILVEKFSYALRDPLARNEIVTMDKPKRGEVAVFKFPPNPSVDFIKRIVGLPGDRIIYRNKTLYIEPACAEGQSDCAELEVVNKEIAGRAEYFRGPYPLDRYTETLGDVSHEILVDSADVPYSQNYYKQAGTGSDEWIVPEGHYFMMGDNRDNSEDSRFWGFVHEDLLVGRAVFIWMSFDMDRDADSWLPAWIPTGIRWQRLGSVQ